MNKELKEYLDKEFKIIFKDFRLRLNDLEKIKNKIYSSGYSKNLPVYLGKIPKFKGSQRELFSCFSNFFRLCGSLSSGALASLIGQLA